MGVRSLQKLRLYEDLLSKEVGEFVKDRLKAFKEELKRRGLEEKRILLGVKKLTWPEILKRLYKKLRGGENSL